MTIRRLIRRLPWIVARAVRDFGVVGGASTLLERSIARRLLAEDRRRDGRLGLEMADAVERHALTVTGDHVDDGFDYVASPSRLVRAVLRALPITTGEFVFVDLGSGKGRTLLVAAERPFAEIVGVEYAEELHAAATRNMAIASTRLSGLPPIRLVLGDAAAFDLPNKPCVVYLNNPFSERVMASVLANVQSSLRAAPRPLYVVYQEARHEPASDRTANLRLLAEAPFLQRRPLSLPLLERLALRPWRIEVFEARQQALTDDRPVPAGASAGSPRG